MSFSPEQLATIKGTWEQHASDPAGMIALMNQYGVDVNGLIQATGLSLKTFADYFYNLGNAPDGFAGIPPRSAFGAVSGSGVASNYLMYGAVAFAAYFLLKGKKNV